MLKIIPAALIGLALYAGTAQAEYTDLSAPSANEGERLVEAHSQAQPYRKEVSCEADECKEVLGAYQTGSWTFQDGSDCRKVTVELEEMKTHTMEDGAVIDLPTLNKVTETVNCPSESELDTTMLGVTVKQANSLLIDSQILALTNGEQVFVGTSDHDVAVSVLLMPTRVDDGIEVVANIETNTAGEERSYQTQFDLENNTAQSKAIGGLQVEVSASDS